MRALKGLAVAMVALAAVDAASAAAQETWPTRTVSVIVPVNAGGGADPLARLVVDRLGQKFGQSFVLDFRPGASMMIGTNAVAKAKPDGYTILFSASTALVNSAVNPNALYNPVTDLVPVIRVAGAPNFVTVNAKVPYNTYEELIKYARDNPGKVNAGVAGIGSSGHYSAAMIKAKTGAEFNLVPYSGAGAIVPDLMSGAIDVTFGFSTAYASGVQAGRVKYLAAMAPERFPLNPDIPATGESKEWGAYAGGWYAISVPKATSRQIVTKLHDAVLEIIKAPDAEKKINELGYAVIGDTPEQAAEAVRNEIAEMKAMIDSGVFKIQ